MGDYLILFLLIGVPVLFALSCGVLAWSGRWRAWARRPVAAFFFTKRNYLPLQTGAAGVLGLCAVPPLIATLEHWENADALWTGAACLVLPIIVTRWWWPAALTPRWHKDWVRRGGEWDTPLWGPGETIPERELRKEDNGWR